MLQIFLIVTILIAIAFAGLAIGIFIKGKFPDTHIEHNPYMKKMGISCAKNETTLCQGRSQSGDCKGCSYAG